MKNEKWDDVHGNTTPDDRMVAFLESPTDSYAILQLREDVDDNIPLMFANYSYLQKKEMEPEIDRYEVVYHGSISMSEDVNRQLEDLYVKFNIDHPDDFRGHSMSVSDIVALKVVGEVSFHYVDSVGFQKLENFMKSENYLKNAEMAMEDDYGIKERIEGKRTKAAKAPKEQRGVSLLIDIENSIKAAQSRGYEQWAKIHNLKLAAKTMNFLTEHKIEQYADLVSRIEEVNAENEKTADALKSVEKRLANMAVLMKHVTTYQKTKPVYEAYRRAKDKDAYRAKQESSLILHEAAVKTLKAAGVTKLPNLAAMQEEYGKLQAQKEALYADYGKLKKQVKEYDVIKQNIDNILRQGKEPERKKGKERE